MSRSKPIEQAIQAIQAGDRISARALLARALSEDPRQAEGWVWLAACLDEPEQRRYCLEQALALRPDDPQIQQALRDMADASGESAVETVGGVSMRDTTPPQADESAANRAAEPANLPDTTGKTTPARPGAGESKPASKSKSGSRWVRVLIWIFIVLIVLASFVLLVLILDQEDAVVPTADAPTHPTQPTQAAAIPVIKLPVTWTPTPTRTLSTTSLRSTSTLIPSATALPSITPYFGYRRILIGRSERGRPVEVFRFGTGEHERLIVAGIHGGSEGFTIDLADTFIAHLQQNLDWIPMDATFYIMRSLNPDGESLGDDPQSRFNANGVDLDRNFPENWKSSWETEGCLTTNPEAAGAASGSELETQAFMEFLSERSIEVLVVYQEGSDGIFPASAPEGGKALDLVQAIAAISPYAYPPPNTGCEISGRLIDWAASLGVKDALAIGMEENGTVELEEQLAVLDLLLHWPQNPPARPSITPRATDKPTATPEINSFTTESPGFPEPVITSSPSLTKLTATISITATITHTPQPAPSQ